MDKVVHLAWERQARKYHRDREVWPFINIHPCFHASIENLVMQSHRTWTSIQA